MRVQHYARLLTSKAKPDLLRGILPDVKGMMNELEFRLLAKLGQRHKIPVPELRLRRQIFMDNGKDLIFDSGLNRCNSEVRNYFNMVFSYANCKDVDDSGSFGTGFLSLKDTLGNIDAFSRIPYHATSPTISGDIRSANTGILAVAGDQTQGLLIGTGNTAESFEDFVIETLTPNGSGTGPPIEFDYSQSELHSVTNSTLTLKDTRIRDFNNNSGVSETIEEVAEYYSLNFSTQQSYLTIRDLTGGDVVANTAQYRVTLESSLVYPS